MTKCKLAELYSVMTKYISMHNTECLIITPTVQISYTCKCINILTSLSCLATHCLKICGFILNCFN